MSKHFQQFLVFALIILLSFQVAAPVVFSTMDDEEDSAQKIDNLDIDFDLSEPAITDNEYVLDFMGYIADEVGSENPIIPLEYSVTDAVYGETVTDEVYGHENEDEEENNDNLGSIVNLPELRQMSWEELEFQYREATVYNYVLPNRTIDNSINKYEFEIYERLIWAMENGTLGPDLYHTFETAIRHILSSQYKIVDASMEDARSLEQYNPTHKGGLRLNQAEVHWTNVSRQLEKGNTRPAMNALQHANFKAQEVLAEHGLEYTRDMLAKDTDSDELPDLVENYYLTDSKNPDTDGDTLTDFYEIEHTYTDPLQVDTNGDGMPDGQEDHDNDGLIHHEEFAHGTDPLERDSDHDSLLDAEELNLGTEPLLTDTDGDSISDGRELELGLNPLDIDTDGDETGDEHEIFTQLIPLAINTENHFKEIGITPEVTLVGPPVDTHSLYYRDAHKIWKHFDRIHGLVGHAVDIDTSEPFDQATLTFHYDPVKLGNTLPEDLRIVWYDEFNHKFVVLPNQILDQVNQTISTETDHFSIYALVDWKRWLETWTRPFKPGRPTTLRGPINEVVVASAFSDKGTGFLNYGVSALEDLKQTPGRVNTQTMNSIAESTLFENAIDTLSSIHNNKWKALIFVVDGQTNLNDIHNQALLEKARKNHIKVFPVNTGASSVDTDLLRLAEETYGRYLDNEITEETHAFEIMNAIYEEIKKDEDADADGIPDRVERQGMRIFDGSFVQTSVSLDDANQDGNADGMDSDGDGLTDGYEMGYTDREGNALEEASLKQIDLSPGTSLKSAQIKKEDKVQIAAIPEDYHHFSYRISDTWYKDTDGDGYVDAADIKPETPYISPVFLLHGLRSNVKIFGAYNRIAPRDDEELNDNDRSLHERYTDPNMQAIIDIDSDSLAKELVDSIGSENVFAFNYANKGDFYKSAFSFNQYTQNLFALGKLQSPIRNGVPEISIIAHSMGGLVARSYIELATSDKAKLFKENRPTIKIKKLVTLATPHWGGIFWSRLWPEDTLVWLDGYAMLQPSHPIFNGSDSFFDVRPDDYFNGLHFKEEINKWSNNTKYYAIIGSKITDISSFNYQDPTDRIDYFIPEFIYSPDSGENYQDQSIQYGFSYINNLYQFPDLSIRIKNNDNWVTVNSGLGYKPSNWYNPFGIDYEINMEQKLVLFGPSSKVSHSQIYKNEIVWEKIHEWIN